MPIITHDKVKLGSGLLHADKGILWGGSALQTIQIARNMPKTPQQAVGYLGVVDYTSGVITSDVTLDAVVTENCEKVDTTEAKANSIYRYAQKGVTVGAEQYVLTSAGVQLAAGQPMSLSLGYLTGTLATYLDVYAEEDPTAPKPLSGEESAYAVVLGDDGAGIVLAGTFDASVLVGNAQNIPVLDNQGLLQQIDDGKIPAGVQSINFNARINREQVLDVRTVQPVQWVTTYPLDLTADLETFQHVVQTGTALPGETGYDPSTFRPVWNKLLTLEVKAGALAKHLATHDAGYQGSAQEGDVYVLATGFTPTNESESVSVGNYLRTTQTFNIADLMLPLEPVA